MQDLLSRPIGEDNFEQEDLNKSLRNMYQEKGRYSQVFSDNHLYADFPKGNDGGRSVRKETRAILKSITKGEITLEEGLEKLDSRIAEKVDKNIAMEVNSKGISYLKNNPELLYEKVREHYLKGDFDNNLVGKLSARRFLDAASKYASKYYGTEHTESISVEESPALSSPVGDNLGYEAGTPTGP